MQRSRSLFAILLLFSIATFVETPCAEAQLFPRLRARINDLLDESLSGPPQAVPPYPPGQIAPRPDARVPRRPLDGLERLRPMEPGRGGQLNPPNRPSRASQPARQGAFTALKPAPPLFGGDRAAQNDASVGVEVVVANDPARRFQGLRVESFSPGSLAENAGLKVGDVIIGLDSVATPSVASVAQMLQRKRPGESVQVRVVREQLVGELTIPLISNVAVEPVGKPPTTLVEPVVEKDNFREANASLSQFGIEIGDSSAEGGVNVIRVAKDSDAVRAGIQPGDRIVSFDGTIVNSGAAMNEQLTRRTLDQPMNLQLVRDDRLLAVTIRRESGPRLPDSDSRAAAEQDSMQSASRSNSLLDGLGSAIGSLFGGGTAGQRDTKTEQSSEQLADDFAFEDQEPEGEKTEKVPASEQTDLEKPEVPVPAIEPPLAIPQPRAFD